MGRNMIGGDTALTQLVKQLQAAIYDALAGFIRVTMSLGFSEYEWHLTA